MSILREWVSSGTIYALWALAFALTGAPQRAFNVVPPTAGLVAGYVAVGIGSLTGNMWASFLMAAGCGCAFAIASHLLIISPLLKFRDPGRAILLATLGLLGVTQAIIALLRTSELVSLREFRYARGIFEFAFSDPGIWIVNGLICAAVFGGLCLFLFNTRLGLLYRGTCDNRDAALFYRLPLAKIDVFAAGAAGFIASIAGLLIAGGRAISPNSGISFAIWGIAGAVIGGRDDVRTSFVGGLAVGLIETIILRYFPSALKDSLLGLMLVVVLLLRPNGIFKLRKRRV